MPAESTSPTPLFNPLAFWADASMSALDAALSSTQNIGDGVDRLARAGASVDPAAAVPAGSQQNDARPSNLGLGLAMHMQSSMFELLSQAWQQWFATLGTLASLGAGGTFKDAERQNPWLNTLRETVAGAAATSSASRSGSARRQVASNDEPATREHAFAAAAPQRGRRAKAGKRAGSRASVKR